MSPSPLERNDNITHSAEEEPCFRAVEETKEEPCAQVKEEPCPSCGLPLDVTSEVLFALVKCPGCHVEVRVRVRVGDYRLLGVLGQGGSGQVFRACRDHQEGSDLSAQEVALKVLEKDRPDYQEYLLLFRNEGIFARLVQHPRVVGVIDLEEDDAGARLVMELMEGGSLHDLITSQNMLNEQRVLETGLEIVKALSAAYELGIIHRDLKPANILYTATGGAKLGDFGLSRSVISGEESDVGEAIESHLMATPDYVAPEIMEGKVGDFYSDHYSLGGALYHALTKDPPYHTEGKSLEELRLMKRSRVKLSFKKWNLLPETATLINRMLEPDPNNRFSSYAELEASLRSALDRLEESGIKKSPGDHPLRRFFDTLLGGKKSS